MGNGGRECDVGLGLKMQSSYYHHRPPSPSPSPSPCSSTRMPMPHHPYHETNDRFIVNGGFTSTSTYYDSRFGSHVNASLAALPPTNTLLQSSSSGGDGSGKGFFTALQWQELIRQTNICNFMMAQIPVPPHLLPSPSLSKSNSGGSSVGSDPEPWRCRRTDGKKWRCSRDVTPDHKYCERHSHKNRPRSRKPVELPSPTSSLRKPLSQSPNMAFATTTPYDYDQPRCSEWLMKSEVTSTNQQFQELMQSSPGLGIASKRDKNQSVFQQNYQEEEDLAGTAARQHLTGGSKCSLTLSMQSGGSGNIGIEEDNQNYSMGMILPPEREHTAQWINSSATWMGSGSAPGGPLGEALCLGIPSNTTTNSTSCEDGLHALNFIR